MKAFAAAVIGVGTLAMLALYIVSGAAERAIIITVAALVVALLPVTFLGGLAVWALLQQRERTQQARQEPPPVMQVFVAPGATLNLQPPAARPALPAPRYDVIDAEEWRWN